MFRAVNEELLSREGIPEEVVFMPAAEKPTRIAGPARRVVNVFQTRCQLTCGYIIDVEDIVYSTRQIRSVGRPKKVTRISRSIRDQFLRRLVAANVPYPQRTLAQYRAPLRIR